MSTALYSTKSHAVKKKKCPYRPYLACRIHVIGSILFDYFVPMCRPTSYKKYHLHTFYPDKDMKDYIICTDTSRRSVRTENLENLSERCKYYWYTFHFNRSSCIVIQLLIWRDITSVMSFLLLIYAKKCAFWRLFPNPMSTFSQKCDFDVSLNFRSYIF